MEQTHLTLSEFSAGGQRRYDIQSRVRFVTCLPLLVVQM